MSKLKINRQHFCGDSGILHFGLAVFEDRNGWFHAFEYGIPAYLQRYEMAEYFQKEGDFILAWVKKNGKWIRINPQGKELKMLNTSSVILR